MLVLHLFFIGFFQCPETAIRLVGAYVESLQPGSKLFGQVATDGGSYVTPAATPQPPNLAPAPTHRVGFTTTYT